MIEMVLYLAGSCHVAIQWDFEADGFSGKRGGDRHAGDAGKHFKKRSHCHGVSNDVPGMCFFDCLMHDPVVLVGFHWQGMQGSRTNRFVQVGKILCRKWGDNVSSFEIH
jgi:hypothetical protein